MPSLSFSRAASLLHVLVELHQEDRCAGLLVQLQIIARGLEGQLPAGLVEEHVVDVLDGGGLEREQFDGRLHGLVHRVEEDEADALFPGQWNQIQLGGKNARKRPRNQNLKLPPARR